MKTCKLITTSRASLSNGDVLILPCEVNYYYIGTNEQAKEAAEEILPIVSDPSNRIAVDIETTGFDPYLNNIILLQIGVENNIQYIFDVRKINTDILKPLLDTNCWKIGHNIKFDSKFIKHHYKVNFRRFFDTFIAEQVIRGGTYYGGSGYSLDAVLKLRLDKEMSIEVNSFSSYANTARTEKVKKQMQRSFLDIENENLSPAQLAYAAQDVSSETIFALCTWQDRRLHQHGTNTLYDDRVGGLDDAQVRKDYENQFPKTLRLWETASLEFKFIEVVVDMELAGIGFSKETHEGVVNNIRNDYKAHREEFLKLLSPKAQQRTLFGTAGINPDSQPQVLDSLNQLGLHLDNTNAHTLELKLNELKEGSDNHKIVKSLLNYRNMSKLSQAFGDKLLGHVHPVTGRIHFQVKQILDTGRISNIKPNLQQIPKKIKWKQIGDQELDKDIKNRPGLRECFQAKPGHQLLVYDYSQQELRVAAAISLDRTMRRAFSEGKELHNYSATLMYREDYDEFCNKVKEKDPESVEKRTIAKVVSFGCLYGSGPANLSRTLNIPFDRAKDVIARYWLAYPMLEKAMQRYGQLANKVGYSNTVLGRRRYYKDIQEKIRLINLEHNPESIQRRLEDHGMEWALKDGDITHENMWKAKKALIRRYEGDISRQAGNHHIQGTSADMTKLAAINIRKDLMTREIPGTIVGLVHDEVIVEVPDQYVDECRVIVIERMKKALNLFCPGIPAEVDGMCSNTWIKE